MSRMLSSVFALVALVLCPGAVLAQYGAIKGTVNESASEQEDCRSPQPLPGVSVVASGAKLDSPKVAVTDADGNFRISKLAPGTYTVRFSLGAFDNLGNEEVRLQAGAQQRVIACLAVPDSITEVVTVSVILPRPPPPPPSPPIEPVVDPGPYWAPNTLRPFWPLPSRHGNLVWWVGTPDR